MKILNLKELKLYTDLSRENALEYDGSKEIANFLYMNMTGLSYHALALKIWNSAGPVEIDESEEKLLREAMNYMKPFVIDALEEQLKEK